MPSSDKKKSQQEKSFSQKATRAEFSEVLSTKEFSSELV